MSPVRCRAGSRSMTRAGCASSARSNNSSRTWVAWRLKSTKLIPPALSCVPKGAGTPARTSPCSPTAEIYSSRPRGVVISRCRILRAHCAQCLSSSSLDLLAYLHRPLSIVDLRMRVLLVEDDAMIAQGLQVALRQAGFTVDWTGDGTSGASALRSTTFDLVLLDLGLPGRDGLEVLQELRRRGDATPVIILTARDEIQERVSGLNAGADD